MKCCNLNSKTLLLLQLLLLLSLSACSQQLQLILDCDTGNEIDDLYAIAQCVEDDQIELIALNSAHFNNVQLLTDSLWHIYPTKNINTLQISQDLNEEILASVGQLDIPHPKGCDRIVGYAWGYYPGAPIPRSPAVENIIAQARKASPEDKLKVMCVGPVTNMAAAVLLDSTIAKNVEFYMLGTYYNPGTRAWDKNSFNARNDINALDVLLNNKDLSMNIMPAFVAKALTFEQKPSREKLATLKTPLAKILDRRWDEVNSGPTWIMWDLALVLALLHPEMATVEKRKGPPENGSRMVNVYTDIDANKMRDYFWNTILK